MTPTIPVYCEPVLGDGDRMNNAMKFVIPSLGAEFHAEFSPSRTAAAIRRANKIIAREIEGASASEIMAALEAWKRPARRTAARELSEAELKQFKEENKFKVAPAKIVVDAQCDIEVPPAPPVVTSDGRYIVDPAARTVTPVDAIPGGIAAVMPVWAVEDDCISFEPRTFDVAPGMESVFEVEVDAAAALLEELGAIFFGAVPRDLKIGSSRTSARLIDGGTFIRAA